MRTSDVMTNRGKRGGRCGMDNCPMSGANWYNHSTRLWYCDRCAEVLNIENARDARELYGHDLCTRYPGKYNLFLNSSGRLVLSTKNSQEVWEAIGELPFGAGYEVLGPQGEHIDEFIPF